MKTRSIFVVFFAFPLLVVFSLVLITCDNLNVSLTEYIEEATGTAQAAGHTIGTDSNLMSNGVTAIPVGETTTITIPIRNLRNYALNLELEGQNDGGKASASLSSDRQSATITIDTPVRGERFELTMNLNVDGRPMSSYELPPMEARFFNADLNSLLLSYQGSAGPPQSVNFGFSPIETSYTVNLPETAEYVIIQAELPAAVFSRCTLSGQSKISGDPPIDTGLLPLNYGTNVYPIVVEADNGTTKTYTLRVNRGLSSANDIQSFTVTNLGNMIGAITGQNINVTVPAGTNLNSTNIEISHTGASISLIGGATVIGSPASFTGVDLSSERTFRVNAVNGETKDYTVTTSLPVITAGIGAVIYGNGTALSPLSSAANVTITVTVSGFLSADDAADVGLSIPPVTGLSYSGHAFNAGTNSISGSAPIIIKTFTIVVSYNGTTAFSTGATSISFTPVRGAASVGSGVNQALSIRDGQAAAETRVIPVNNTNFSVFNTYVRTATGLAQHYALSTAITLSGTWTPIGSDTNPFTGTFNGGNFAISGLSITGTGDYRGLFGYISGNSTATTLATTGVVRNVNISGSVEGRDNVGAVVGHNHLGLVEGCVSSVSVTGSGHQVGGIVGQNTGAVRYSYSTGSVTGSNAGPAYANSLGGVVGHNDFTSGSRGLVEYCYATGNVSGDNHRFVGGVVGRNMGGSSSSIMCRVSNSYATGNVSGSDYIGGVVGYNYGLVEYCYATGDVTGGSPVAGIVGQNQPSATAMPSSVSRCVALNAIIRRRGSESPPFGTRRIANNTGNLALNYARYGMLRVNDNNAPSNPLTASSEDGANVTETGEPNGGWRNQTFWQNTMSWSFTGPDAVWEMNPNNLPRLRNMPGNPAQNHNVRDIPPP